MTPSNLEIAEQKKLEKILRDILRQSERKESAADNKHLLVGDLEIIGRYACEALTTLAKIGAGNE